MKQYSRHSRDRPGAAIPGRVWCAAFVTLVVAPPGRAFDVRFDSSFISASTGGRALWVAAGDFDGDGVADIATANSGPQGISVWLGNAGRIPRSRLDSDVVADAGALAAGDFDADGRLDLAVAHRQEGEGLISILLGDGDGTFTVHTSLAAAADYLTTSHLNSDAHLDLVAASRGTDEVFVWRGDGGGGFGDRVTLSFGRLPTAVASADLDSDGDLDLAACVSASRGGVSLLFNGNGSFGFPAALDSYYSPRAIVLADLDGDTVIDIATANATNVMFFPNLGRGTFGMGQVVDTRGTPEHPYGLAASDLDGDGFSDLVAVWDDGTLSVYRGTPGGLAKPRDSVAAPGASTLVTSDFDGDGRADVAMTTGTGMVAIAYGNGDGSFGSEGEIPTGGPTRSVATCDLDRDGALDIAATYANDRSAEDGIAFFAGTGTGAFLRTADLAAPKGSLLALGDLDLDGDTDAVLSGSSLRVLLGRGDGGFDPLPDAASSVAADLADFDGDGILDLVGAGRQVSLRRGIGDGTFAEPRVLGAMAQSHINDLESLDVDEDGDMDILVSYGSSYFEGGRGALGTILGNGDGSFAPQLLRLTGWSCDRMAAGNVDGDAHTDIVLVQYAYAEHGSSYRRVTLLGTGTPELGAEILFTGGFAWDLALDDLDGDSFDDLLELQWTNDVCIASGAGDGTFGERSCFGVGKSPRELRIADLNSDGRQDLAVANAGSPGVTILWNRSHPTHVSIEDFVSTATEAGIRLHWRVAYASGDPAFDVGVQRADRREGPYRLLAVLPTSAGVMSYVDGTALPGQTYWYRLLLMRADGSSTLAGPIEAARDLRHPMTALARVIEPPGGSPVRIRYTLGEASRRTRFEILDVRGRLVRALDVADQAPGSHEALWDRVAASGRRAGRGLYIVRLTTSDAVLQRKVVLVR